MLYNVSVGGTGAATDGGAAAVEDDAEGEGDSAFEGDDAVEGEGGAEVKVPPPGRPVTWKVLGE